MRSSEWTSDIDWQRVAAGASRPMRRRKREKVHLLWSIMRVENGGARRRRRISGSVHSAR